MIVGQLTVESMETVHESPMGEFTGDDLMEQTTEEEYLSELAVGETESVVPEIQGTILAVDQVTVVPEIQGDQEYEFAEMVDGTPMGEFAVDDLMDQTTEDQNPNALAVGEPESIVTEIKGTILAVEQLTVIQGDGEPESTKMVDATPMVVLACDDLMEQTTEDQILSAALAGYQETNLAVENSPVTGMDHPLDNSNPENGVSKDTSPPKRKSEELSAETNMKNVTGSIKKIKITPQKWECSLCQVSATSEQHLRDHIQGKKHKAKVTKLKSSSSGDDNGNISSNEVVKLTSCSGDVNGDNNTNKSAEPGISYLSAENQDKEDLETITEPNKKKTGYWCEMCGIGTNSEDQMAIHQKGKKHISSAAKLGLPSEQKIATAGQDRVEIKLASKEESKDPQTSVLAKAALLEQVGVTAADESCEVGVFMGQRETEMKFFCKMCRVTMYDGMKMDKHRKSEKHMNKLKKNLGAVIVISKVQTETDGELVSKESDATVDS